MTRTHLILDGLQDLDAGRDLSRRWATAGFDNAVDVAGQSAWLAPAADRGRSGERADAALTEADVDRAALIARAYGLEVRDRAGQTFIAANELAPLRDRLVYEYKSRFATAVVFTLPALAVHYLGPMLAGGPTHPRDMLYPWLFEALLVGWACIAAGWPILWQGALSLIHLRATADLLTSLLLIVAYVPSVVGLIALGLGERAGGLTLEPGGGPLFHATAYVLLLATLQRWRAHRAAAALAGKALFMVRPFHRLVLMWMVFSAAVAVIGSWRLGVAMAMLLPPMIGLGAINRLSPGWSAVLPVLVFGIFLLLAPQARGHDIQGVVIEIAAGFTAMMTFAMILGWRAFISSSLTGSQDGLD